MIDDILFYGDPHRDFEPLLEEIENRRPKAVIILGDCDAERPLEQLLAPAIDAIGRENIWWIHGNHDADTPEFYDNTFGSALADQNLHGRVVEIAGVRVAGLGGVFRGQVWYPRELDAEKKFWSQDEYLKSLARQHRWRGGLPLRQRATIFPSEVEKLSGMRCDVLVSHEGPSLVEYGFPIMETLASTMGAKALVHGHLHVDYIADSQDGVRCVGCADKQPRWGFEIGVDLDREADARRSFSLTR